MPIHLDAKNYPRKFSENVETKLRHRGMEINENCFKQIYIQTQEDIKLE